MHLHVETMPCCTATTLRNTTMLHVLVLFYTPHSVLHALHCTTLDTTLQIGQRDYSL